MSESQRPTRAEINLSNLAFNFASAKKFIGGNLAYMAVVKADAYGHGAVECAKRLERENVDWLGVALPEEGLVLRRAGIKSRILCLGGFWDGQENLLLDNDLTPVVYQITQAEKLSRAASQSGRAATNIHVKIDTGMGRIGVRYDETVEFARSLSAFTNLRLEGLMTHFAAADDLSENDFTREQINRFYRAAEVFERSGFTPKYFDLANSPGAVAHEQARGNLVRLGGILYGLGGDVLPAEIAQPELKPVLSLKTRISHLKIVPPHETLGYSRTFETTRDSLIATIPIGYHDGFSRALSNIGRVLINGASVPVVGRISMDWTILDVTEVPGVKIGDEVIVIGAAHGDAISAEELAALTGTISYEVTCGISCRVPRIYVESR